MGNISTSLYIVYTINDKESIKLVEKCYKESNMIIITADLA